MNKYKVAYENIISLVGNDNEDIKVLKELVNRATPKLMHYEKDGIGDSDAFGGTGSLTYYVAECPHCESELNDTSASYCQYCGQAIDWGDEDDYEH